MTRDEYEQWTFEQQLVTAVIAKVEQAEHAELRALGFPTEPGRISQALRDRPATKATRHARRRAFASMKTLALLAECRRHLSDADPNPRLAAHAALLAGLFAGDAGRAAVARAGSRKGGQARGTAIAKQAATQDAEIGRHAARWRISYELQEAHPSLPTYVAEKIKKSPKTVARRLKRGQ